MVRWIIIAVLVALLLFGGFFYVANTGAAHEHIEAEKWSQQRRLTQVQLSADEVLRQLEADPNATDEDFDRVSDLLNQARGEILNQSVNIRRRGSQQTPPPVYQTPPADLYTPTGVEVEQLEGGARRIAFPPNADWTVLGVLAPGEVATVDPESKVWCYSSRGVTGPNGWGAVALPEWQEQLPDGQRPFCAVVWKVEDGVLKGAVNDFLPFAVDVDRDGNPDPGRADNLGAPAIIIRSR